MHRPIAPLFNISKRPRQAVVSDPCDSQTSAPRQSLTNTGYVGNNHQRPPPQLGNQPRNRPVSNQMNLLPPKPSLPQYNMKRAPQPGPYGDGTSGMEQGRGSNSFKSAQQKPSNAGGQIQRSQGFQNNSVTQRSGYSGTNKQVVKSGQSFSSSNNYQRNSGMNQGINTQQTVVNRQSFSNNPSFISKQPVSTRVNTASTLPPKPNLQTFNTHAYNKAQIQGPAATFNPPCPQPSTSYATTSAKPVPKYGSTKSSTDKSLRVFTASVESVLQWGNGRHAIPALFEVYGIVDSAVTVNQFAQAKQFLLKDETGVMQCIFFEIDRGLDRLTRGQWHRCMGAFDPKLEKFKCVSVKPSSLSERSLAKLSMKTSEEAMRVLVRELRES